MKRLLVKHDLWLELWEAWEHNGELPVLKLRRNEDQHATEIQLNEVRFLIEAIATAAGELAEATVTPPTATD